MSYIHGRRFNQRLYFRSSESWYQKGIVDRWKPLVADEPRASVHRHPGWQRTRRGCRKIGATPSQVAESYARAASSLTGAVARKVQCS